MYNVAEEQGGGGNHPDLRPVDDIEIWKAISGF
jgi:hypothetical protein